VSLEKTGGAKTQEKSKKNIFHKKCPELDRRVTFLVHNQVRIESRLTRYGISLAQFQTPVHIFDSSFVYVPELPNLIWNLHSKHSKK
jgi:hypothetical protein